MALTDEGAGGIPATMLVGPTGYAGPMYQGGNGGGFGNGFGGDGWWVILLFLLLLGNNGWGNNGIGNCGGNAGGLYPWMNQSNQINGGFRDQMINSTVNGIQQSINGIGTQLCNGFGDVQMSLCNGFAGVNQTVNSGFANAETAANARQMANMNQAFGAQTAMMQGFNGVNAGVADLRYTVATEACADRAAVGDALQNVTMQNMGNTNQIVNAINGGIQSIKDQLCDYRNAQKDDTIATLRQELLYARGQASQDVQTAAIRTGQATTANQLVQELRSCPVPSMPVYGMTPIFTCPQNNGCGCGCNG